MNGLRAVISLVYQFANTPLSFGEFKFSIWQTWIGFIAISLVFAFIKRIFD